MTAARLITSGLIVALALIAMAALSSCSTPQQTERTLDLAAKAIYIYSITESGK
jgi:hypothetical protein